MTDYSTDKAQKRINTQNKLQDSDPLLNEPSRVWTNESITIEQKESALAESHSIYRYLLENAKKSNPRPDWLSFNELIKIPANKIIRGKNGIKGLQRQLNKDLARVVKGGYNNQTHILVINPALAFYGRDTITKKEKKAGDTHSAFKKAYEEYKKIESIHTEVFAKAEESKNKSKTIEKQSENSYNNDNHSHNIPEGQMLVAIDEFEQMKAEIAALKDNQASHKNEIGKLTQDVALLKEFVGVGVDLNDRWLVSYKECQAKLLEEKQMTREEYLATDDSFKEINTKANEVRKAASKHKKRMDRLD
jgi:hypothetical protein